MKEGRSLSTVSGRQIRARPSWPATDVNVPHSWTTSSGLVPTVLAVEKFERLVTASTTMHNNPRPGMIRRERGGFNINILLANQPKSEIRESENATISPNDLLDDSNAAVLPCHTKIVISIPIWSALIEAGG